MHQFIFEPGVWLGKGKVTFNTSIEDMAFVMCWQIHKTLNQDIHCVQEIEYSVMREKIKNVLQFSEISSKGFRVQIHNSLFGDSTGKGIITPSLISWEFEDDALHLNGFEVYEKQSDGSYRMRGEYATPDQLRTKIEGELWLKSS